MASGSVMMLALNEVETTVTKAAQGCGLDYGNAAEIGAAASWLCARGLDGISESVAVLSVGEDDQSVLARLGMASVDLAVATGSPQHVADCTSPLMLRALAARAGCTVDLDDPCADGIRTWVVALGDAPEARSADDVQVAANRAWDQILKWAALTYVPSSEHSRIAGAGAGLTDND
ncbi:MAG: DUF3726 domain-containing protein [Acidimicrobiales bacterium]